MSNKRPVPSYDPLKASRWGSKGAKRSPWRFGLNLPWDSRRKKK